MHSWDGMHLVLELNGSTVKARYLRGAGLICQLIDSSTFYYLFNPHGDVVQRADQSGNLGVEYDYDAFGNNTRRYNVGFQPTDGLDTDPNPFRYCGEYFDSELGEIYLRNRCYAPGTGRFSSEDPIRSGGNWYGYCDGNPVRYKDPMGLDSIGVGGSGYIIDNIIVTGEGSEIERIVLTTIYTDAGQVPVVYEITPAGVVRFSFLANDYASLQDIGGEYIFAQSVFDIMTRIKTEDGLEGLAGMHPGFQKI